MEGPAHHPPIGCDMSAAPDTAVERVAEYQRLFARALVGRERTADGIVFRLSAEDGIEAWVGDLADREKACCAFFTFTVTTVGAQVHWAASVVDDDIARAVLDELYSLPDTAGAGVDAVRDRFTGHGLRFVSGPSGGARLLPRPFDDGRAGHLQAAAGN
jgi:hypothetical protein